MKDQLKKLLLVADPKGEIFTESVQNEFVTLIEGKVRTAKENAVQDTVKLYEGKLEKLDDEHASKLKMIVEKIDTDYTGKLEQFVAKIDEDHSAKVKTLVESIDENHAAKVEQLVEAIDEDHSKKLEQIKEFYETKHAKVLSEKVEEMVDTYLDDVAPEEEVTDSERLAELEDAIAKIREIVLGTEIKDKVDDEVKEAMIDAKEQIEEARKEANKLMVEKIELNKKISLLTETVAKSEAKSLLIEKTAALTTTAKMYVESVLKNASKEEIIKKFDTVLNEFKSQDQKNSKERAQKIISEKKDQTPTVAPGKKVIVESTEETIDSSGFDAGQFVHLINRSYSPSTK